MENIFSVTIVYQILYLQFIRDGPRVPLRPLTKILYF